MLLSINENDPRPIYLQLITQVKEQVGNGSLRPDDELPSVRELADSLGINMHTVRSAYLKLQEQGIIVLHLGRRARIARRLPVLKDPNLAPEFQSRLKEVITDALLAGIDPSDLRELLDQHITEMQHLKISPKEHKQ